MKQKLFACILVLALAVTALAGCWGSGEPEDPTPTPAEADAKLVADLNSVLRSYQGTIALRDADGAAAVIAAQGYTTTSILTKEEGAYLLFDPSAGQFVIAKAEDGQMKLSGAALAANTTDYAPEALFANAAGSALYVMSGNEGDALIAAISAVRNFADAVYPNESANPTQAEIASAKAAVEAKIADVTLDSARETLSARFQGSTFVNRYGNTGSGTDAIIISNSTSALTAKSFAGLTLSDYDNVTVPASVRSVEGAFEALKEKLAACVTVNDSALKAAVESEAEAAGQPLLVNVNDGSNDRSSLFVRRLEFNRDTILSNLDYINQQMVMDGDPIAELVVTGLNADGSYNVDVNIFDANASAMSLYNTVNAALTMIQQGGGKSATVTPYGYSYSSMIEKCKAQGRQYTADQLMASLGEMFGAPSAESARRSYAAGYGSEYQSFEALAYAYFADVWSTDRAGVDAQVSLATNGQTATLAAAADALAAELKAASVDAYIEKFVNESAQIYSELDLTTVDLTTLATEIVLSLYGDPEADFYEERSIVRALLLVNEDLKQIVETMETFIPYCQNRITVLAGIEQDGGAFQVAYHFTFNNCFGQGA